MKGQIHTYCTGDAESFRGAPEVLLVSMLLILHMEAISHRFNWPRKLWNPRMYRLVLMVPVLGVMSAVFTCSRRVTPAGCSYGWCPAH